MAAEGRTLFPSVSQRLPARAPAHPAAVNQCPAVPGGDGWASSRPISGTVSGIKPVSAPQTRQVRC